ncbi:hypothetical protein ACFSCW_15140 [Sphingomonas tabacisoli]|uniref:Antitoxin n=1 Tax=Sphingomonas tabacisoli TaxID=2249466 RepID=A0ABW4I777_9SPHN
MTMVVKSTSSYNHQMTDMQTIDAAELGAAGQGLIGSSEHSVIAVLSNGQPTAYLVSAAAWEALLELVELVRQREGQEAIPVSLDELVNEN